MKILLTNDDGIRAEGLRALHRSIQRWSEMTKPRNHKVVVIAPDRGRSECSHSISSGQKFKVHQIQPDWYAVDGTPVDCVRVGLDAISKDADLVISGVNAGANLGADLLVSGTYAAAKEAALAGRPALAISHYRRPDVAKTWEHLPAWLHEILSHFSRECLRYFDRQRGDRPPLWNVNLPAVQPDASKIPPIRECEVDQNLMTRQSVVDWQGVAFESDFHSRPRDSGSDVDECFRGSITLSKINPRIG